MPSLRPSSNPLHRLVESWNALLERREHDAAMQDPNIAAEHAFAASRATSFGEPGCLYCR
jgi:hypothetical protein